MLSFVTAPDFEKPDDSDKDNVYEVSVQASDGLGGVSTQALAISVTNVADTGIISYSATTFVEAAANDGSIATTSTITLSNDTFAGAVGATLGTVSNVPAGLSASLIKTSDTTATLGFAGKAAAHANANDVNNLSVSFGNADFTSGSAANVGNATRSDLRIDFADPEPIKSLGYSATTFVEAVANDGSITTTSTITLSNDTFTGAVGATLGTVSNVPAGLSASLIKTSDTTAILSFTGKAAAHANANDVNNLSVSFGNADFAGGSAANVGNATRSDLRIDFTDPPPIKSLNYSATTFVEAVANDGSITTTSTITLSNDTFTGSVGATLGTVNNVPAGLSASLIKTSDTTATLGFTGKAAAHANANDVSSLSVSFSNADFAGGSAAGVSNATKSDLRIDFTDPAPITPEPIKSLSYSATTFVEAVANDGSITTTSTITLSNDTFTGAVGAALGTVSNVPAGLSASLIKTSGTTATLSFTGKATAHANANDINNLSVSFGNADFTGGSAAGVSNATRSDLTIDFADAVVVPPNKVVDGVTVGLQSSIDTATGLEQQTLSIPTISASRVEDTSTTHATLADIGLDVSINTPAIQAQLAAGLPIGVAMTASGPVSLVTGAQASTDLLARINQKATTPAASEMVAAAQDFLSSLGSTSVLDKTITLTASSAPSDALLITGNNTKTEAIVLDASGLPANSIVQLDNVDFSAVIGALRVTGGAGGNRIVGDGSAQWFAMGAGNDTVLGGAGNDVLSGARSDVGQWTFYLDANGAIQAQFQGGNLASAALDNKHADMYFLNASVASVKQVALLYEAAFGRATDLGGLNFYLTQQSAPEQIAKALLNAPEWNTVHGSAASAMGNEAFINGLYQTALGRVADTAGKQFWLDAMDKGLGREQVVLAFANSSEMHMHWTMHKASALASAIQSTESGWVASSGDDRMDGGSGSDTLVGGDGVDTVVYSGVLPSYKFLLTKDGEIKLADTATGARDTLLGFELGAFNGQQFDISFTQAAQTKLNTLGMLYQTILDRPADLGGLNYWLKADLSAQQYAQGMLVDKEFVQRNGQLSDKAFVELLYRNSLSHDADAAGLKLWSDYLNAGHSRAEMVEQWIQTAEVVGVQYGAEGLWLV